MIQRQVRERRRYLLWSLVDDGPVEATNATAEAVKRVPQLRFANGREMTSGGVAQFLKSTEAEGLIELTVEAKRTRRIAATMTADELAEHPDYGERPADLSQLSTDPIARVLTLAVKPAETPPETPRIDVPTVAPTATPLATLASLCALMVDALPIAEQMLAGTAGQLDTLEDRVAVVLDDNQTLRAKIKRLGDELDASRDTARVLADQVRVQRREREQVEHNLKAVLGDKLSPGQVERLRHLMGLDRMMRQPPSRHAYS